jgi:molecular chaperone DnaK (HSP70)
LTLYSFFRIFLKFQRHLGKLELFGLESAPRGTVQVEVFFEIDVNRSLVVSLTEKSSGRIEKLTVPLEMTRFERGELQKIIRDADDNFDLDETKRDAVSAGNALFSFISNLKLVMGEAVFGEKLTQSDRTTLTEKCAEAEQWLTDNLVYFLIRYQRHSRTFCPKIH